MASGVHPQERRNRGLIVGELLLAVLLLAVAVSSLAALMYSVSHRTETRQEGRQSTTACVGKGGTAAGNCAPRVTSGGGAKLLRSSCVNRDGIPTRGCNDAVAKSDSSEETILKTRTDSASIALVAKKQKPADRTTRPDRGFIR